MFHYMVASISLVLFGNFEVPLYYVLAPVLEALNPSQLIYNNIEASSSLSFQYLGWLVLHVTLMLN